MSQRIPDLRIHSPNQAEVLHEIHAGDEWKKIERYINRTTSANGKLVPLRQPITLNVTRWRKGGLIKKAVKALDASGWDVAEDNNKKHHYLFVVAKRSPTVNVTPTMPPRRR